MAAEFYIVFDEPSWYERNQGAVKTFIRSLGTFRKEIDANEYWLRGDEPGGNWTYGVRIFTRPRDILVEISSHPASIVNDLRELNRLISEHAKIKVVDDDGERVDDYE
ncbi:hypothetical protein [Pseudoduganella armeniaca]|uniref:hypothetical protein n=1 Tax=Pseudoduganella armeniaca TaxID=2072590 RepID=UPI0011B1CCB3|nr:hypothetical protein [Pseudoduganella armeniaca]